MAELIRVEWCRFCRHLGGAPCGEGCSRAEQGCPGRPLRAGVWGRSPQASEARPCCFVSLIETPRATKSAFLGSKLNSESIPRVADSQFDVKVDQNAHL